MIEYLFPILLCVVLPIVIVLIESLTKINGENKRAQIILKVIEANKDIDTDKLVEALKTPRKSAREKLSMRLLLGCIFTLIGVALVIVGIVSFCMGSEFASDPVTVPLILGGISLAVGLSYLVVCFVTRGQIKD